MGELKKYAVYALSYLDKALELHFRKPFRKWRFTKYIYKQKIFCENSRGLQLRSQSWIRSKLLSALEIGEILEIALYEVIEERASERSEEQVAEVVWGSGCR